MDSDEWQRGERREGRKERKKEDRDQKERILSPHSGHTEHSTRVPLLVLWSNYRQLTTDNTPLVFGFFVHFLT